MHLRFKDFIGKRIQVKVPIGRDDFGKSNGKMTEVGGICNHIGHNKILGMPIVVVINRMPIELESLKQITIC
jgi:hypothetical protein